jgi:hypothetical protein
MHGKRDDCGQELQPWFPQPGYYSLEPFLIYWTINRDHLIISPWIWV